MFEKSWVHNLNRKNIWKDFQLKYIKGFLFSFSSQHLSCLSTSLWFSFTRRLHSFIISSFHLLQCSENVWHLLPGWFLRLSFWRPGWARVCLQGTIHHQISRDLPQTWGTLNHHDAKNKNKRFDTWLQENKCLKDECVWSSGVLLREVWGWAGWNYQGLQPSGQNQTGSQQGDFLHQPFFHNTTAQVLQRV